MHLASAWGEKEQGTLDHVTERHAHVGNLGGYIEHHVVRGHELYHLAGERGAWLGGVIVCHCVMVCVCVCAEYRTWFAEKISPPREKKSFRVCAWQGGTTARRCPRPSI